MEFDALLLGTYTLRIVTSSWRSDPFIIMKCSLSVITFLTLKSAPSEIKVAPPALLT